MSEPIDDEKLIASTLDDYVRNRHLTVVESVPRLCWEAAYAWRKAHTGKRYPMSFAEYDEWFESEVPRPPRKTG